MSVPTTPSGTETTGRFNFDNMGYNYAETKLEAETRLRELHLQGLDLVLIYPGFMCGPYDHTLQLGRVFFDLRDGVLRPTSHGSLSREQRRELIRGVHYAKDEVGKLMDTLPGLREKGVPVKVLTSRLPSGAQLQPQVEIGLESTVEGLQVTPSLVYGDPPIARLTDGVFRVLGPVVPSRDIGAEKTEARRFEDLMDLSVGQSRVLAPDQAAAFLRDRLPRHRGRGL